MALLHGNSMLIYNVFYRSNEQFHIRFDGGERKEESYYLYYIFYEDGTWLCKTASQADLNLNDFLNSVDLSEVIRDPDHSEPMDNNQELLYQSGKYKIRGNTVHITWRNKHLEEEGSKSWHFRIQSAEIISTDFGEVQLQLVPN